MSEDSPAKYVSWKKEYFKKAVHDLFWTECSCHGFGLYHTYPKDFIESQWEWMNSWIYVTYRALLAIGMIVWIGFDIPGEIDNIEVHRIYLWFVYATNWSFGLLTVTFFALAVYCMVYNCPKREAVQPKWYQPLWLMYTIACNSIIFVCLVYWVALASSKMHVFETLLSQLKHSLSACIAVVDIALSAIPFRFVHVVYILLVGLVYTLFSYFFWLGQAQGPMHQLGQIYPGFDWSQPQSAVIICVIFFFLVIFIQLFLYLVYFTRVTISVFANGRGFHPDVRGKHSKTADSNDDQFSVTSETTGGQPEYHNPTGVIDYGTVE